MAGVKKFGTFGGVFTPSVLSIIGVIMYLRLPWIVGNAGLWGALGIVFVAHIISICTGLSVASIATDKTVEGGGSYYIISRSLGLPIGGTLGWALFAGLSLSISLYIIGFTEISLSILNIEPTLENIRIAGSIVLFSILILTLISTSLTIKTQYLIMGLVVLSFISIFFGKHPYTPMGAPLAPLADSPSWITLFAIFFPAVTGFQAGISMSGDLKNPRKSIPRGTILAILSTFIIYIIFVLFFAFTIDRGQLANDPDVLMKTSWISQLVIAGILGATLSSALGGLLSAPRILQAVASDKIAPKIFAKGHGVANEPRYALILSFIIAQGGVLIGELNALARLVSIFFIITYGFLNITYSVESWSSSDFRPTFKIPRLVSIVGAVVSIVLMIQLDILAFIAAVFILGSLFFYLRRKELNLSSGDSRTGLWASVVKNGLMRLAKSNELSRNWRPNIILFSGGVKLRPHLPEIAGDLVGKLGVFTNFELTPIPSSEEVNPLMSSTAELIFETTDSGKEVLTRRHNCRDVYEGIGIISSVYGFSGFEPNMVMMGWPKEPLNNRSFLQLLPRLMEQQYNFALLKYDPELQFRGYDTIDIWWQGGEGALSFALHLTRSLTASHNWRRAKVRVLAVAENYREKERYNFVISHFLSEMRIEALIKVIEVSDKVELREVVAGEGGESSISIVDMGLFSDGVERVVERSFKVSQLPGSFLFIKPELKFGGEELLSEGDTRREEGEQLKSIREKLSSDHTAVMELTFEEHPYSQLLKKCVGDSENAIESFVESHLGLVSNRRRELLNSISSLLEGERGEISRALFERLNSYRENYLERDTTEVELAFYDYFATLERLARDSSTFDKRRESYFIYHLYSTIADQAKELFKMVEEESLATLAYIGEIGQLIGRGEEREEILSTIERALKRIDSSSIVIKEWLREQNSKAIEQLALELTEESDRRRIRGYRKKNKESIQKVAALSLSAVEMSEALHNRVNRTLFDLNVTSTKDSVEKLLTTLESGLQDEFKELFYYPVEQFKERLKGDKELESLMKLLNEKESSAIEHKLTLFSEGVLAIIESVKEELTIKERGGEYLMGEKKLFSYYLSNELLNRAEQQSVIVLNQVSLSLERVKNLVKLAGYTSERDRESSGVERAENRAKVVENIKGALKEEHGRIAEAVETLFKVLNEGIVTAFEPLSSWQVTREGVAIKKVIEVQPHKRSVKRNLLGGVRRVGKGIEKSLADLLYRRSEGTIWAEGVTVAREESTIEGYQKEQKIIAQLPFYYLDLFTGGSGIGRDFWIEQSGVEGEGINAIDHFLNGVAGALLISGERRSGKSTLARSLAISRFKESQVSYIRAPREATTSLVRFERALYESIRSGVENSSLFGPYGGRGSLDALLTTLKEERVVVIDDLELWWKRSEGGRTVVERVVELIKAYGDKVLFIITVNSHALPFIENVVPLKEWMLDSIVSKPFSAKELKELVLSRHRAGGIKFKMEEKLEENFSEWDYARLFDRIYLLSGGNPGYAINVWLKAVKEVDKERITMQFPKKEGAIPRKLIGGEEGLLLLQFVLHRRLSVGGVAEMMESDYHYIASKLGALQRVGLLVERQPKHYSLNPFLIPAIVAELRELKLL